MVFTYVTWLNMPLNANLNIVVFGKNGQVATALKELLPNSHFIASTQASFLKPETVKSILKELKPNIVINAAAYTLVDKAEEERARALQINALTPKVIAQWCEDNDATMVHYSTDYVYSGAGTDFWSEDDAINPVNIYGFSKAEGDRLIGQSKCRHYILRVSWIYSSWGNNFVKSMLRLGAERDELRIVSDQIGSPTSAKEIALATISLLEEVPKFGVYHFRGGGMPISWFEFANEIFRQAREKGFTLKVKSVLPIPSAEYKTLALRPLNSRLNTCKFETAVKQSTRHWQKSLSEVLDSLRFK